MAGPRARVVGILGPTASGKSDVALALAGLVPGGEIVSADAMQCYAELPILTNQPTTAERAAVPHHLVGCWSVAHAGDVAQYAALAHAAIDDVLARGGTAIVVGGTGLYLRAALAELALPPEPPAGLRAELEAAYDADGPGAAHARLAALDPAAAARIHANDRRRVVRALELHALGRSLAPDGADRLWTDDVRHPTLLVGLAVPRPVLHARIAARARRMLDGGAVEEVRALLGSGIAVSPTALMAHGLRDVIALVEGRCDRATCERRIVEQTRQYARRQETWLRRLPAASVAADRPAADAAAAIAALRG